MSFDITPLILLRESLVSTMVLQQSRQSVVTFFPGYWVKFRIFNRGYSIPFCQLFTVSWNHNGSHLGGTEYHILTFFGIVKINSKVSIFILRCVVFIFILLKKSRRVIVIKPKILYSVM